MKPGGGKAKGAQFERVVCARFSLWVTGGADKDVFWRSSMSGGRATIHVRKGERNRQAGDITAVRPEGHLLTDNYFVECKHVRDLMIDRFFLEQSGVLWKFWQHACKQARDHERMPLVIAKQNGYPVLVVSRPNLKLWGDDEPLWTSPLARVRVSLFDALTATSYNAFKRRMT